MNLSDTIKNLFEPGVVNITMGKKPDQPDVLWVQCQAVIATGLNDRIQIVVQNEHRDLSVAFARCHDQLAHVAELQVNVLPIRGGNGG